MQKRKIAANSALAICIGWLGLLPLNAVEDNEGHRFGEWPAISAMIENEFQKNLNFDDRDFLIEIWFKPLPVLKDKGNGRNILISKKCADFQLGYTLSYQNSQVNLTLCGRNTELDKDQPFSVEAGLTTNEWSYIAASYSHAARKLTFYKNGVKLKEYPKVELGNLSNKDTFNIGYYENRTSSTAHCQIREVRIWKVKDALPANVDALVAGHHARPQEVAAALTGNAGYSRWIFSSSNEDIADQGNNRNTLFYLPYGYKERIQIKPFPEKPSGKTYYVDNRNPQASDEGTGTKDKPFKTIKPGLKTTYPGDVLHICAGLYREAIYPRAGENGNPVTIEGETGAVVSGADPLERWEKQDGGLWVFTNWNGNYRSPDLKQGNDRATPGNLLFVDDQPMDFVRTKAELVPGTWTTDPVQGGGSRTIVLSPLPGIDPTLAPVEISEVRAGATAVKFNHIKGIHFTRNGVSLIGMGNVVEDNTIDWSNSGCIGVVGLYQVVRNNKMLWGVTGFGGYGGSHNLFENNLISYCGWRNIPDTGPCKIIPGAIDNIIRNNEECYNNGNGIWYDTICEGNLFEGNVSHDSQGNGFMDEFNFGNTIQSNLCYNNANGLAVCNSKVDRVYRNIAFNNMLSGIFFRWSSGQADKAYPEDAHKAKLEELMAKLDERRYQGWMISYEREKKFRALCDRYYCYYSAGVALQNTVEENVVFNNGKVEVNQPLRYSPVAIVHKDENTMYHPRSCSKGSAADKDIENTFVKNYYWNDTTNKIFNNGWYFGRDFTLREWQEISGQDADSQWINPYDDLAKMPAWFQERFKFKKGEFRPIMEANAYVENVRGSISRTVLLSRLLRAKTIAVARFADPMLAGVLFDRDGEKCASIWSKGVGLRDFIVPGVKELAYENKFLQRKKLEVKDEKVRVFVMQDPITLIGIGTEIKEDRSAELELPLWTEPGKVVAGKLTLDNPSRASRDYDLKVSVGEGWQVAHGNIPKTLNGGKQVVVDVDITPPPDVRYGMFQVKVAGRAGGSRIEQTKYFGIGHLPVLKHVEKGKEPKIDGGLAEWRHDVPNGIADSKDRLVFGKENWKGPEDLSARLWLRWHAERELYMSIEVTDDRLVTNHRSDDPRKSDSVQLCVDVRAPWKQQFMNNYTPGAFELILVPGEEGTEGTYQFGKLKFGNMGYTYGGKMLSKRTARGYIIEVDLHFGTGQVEDPGWVANREIRVGVLVNDSDDPNGKDRKSTLGFWRTTANVGEDCTSMTTFMMEK